MGILGADSTINFNEIYDGVNIKIEPLIGNLVNSLNNFYINSRFPKLIMDNNQKQELYGLAVNSFIKNTLTMVPLKGDPKKLIEKIELFGKCCAESYKTVGAHDYCRDRTMLLVAEEVSKIKNFVGSGSYSHLNIEEAVKESIEYIVREAHIYQKFNSK